MRHMPSARTKAQKKQRDATRPSRVAAVRKAKNTGTMEVAASVDPNKPLTGKQLDFIRAVAEGDSIPNAMARAGYNEQPSYGYRLMKMPNVLKVLAQFQEEYRQAAQLTKQDVMNMLKEAYDDAKRASEPATMVSAAREIGKLCGFYEPTKVTVNINDTSKFSQLTDAELFALIEQTSQVAQLEYGSAETSH